MMRLIVNRARIHFNNAVEQAKELNYFEALGELNSALELNARLVEAHVLKGSILGRLERVDEAREALQEALRISPQAARAHRYLLELGDVEKSTPLRKRLGLVYGIAGTVTALAVVVGIGVFVRPGGAPPPRDTPNGGTAWSLLAAGDLAGARASAANLPHEQRAALEAAADRRVDDALELSRVALEAGGAPAALEALRKLDDLKLGAEDRRVVERQRALIATSEAEKLAALLTGIVAHTSEAHEAPAAQIASFAEAKDRYTKLFPESTDVLDRALANPRTEARALVESRLADDGASDSVAAAKSLAGVAPLAALVNMDDAVTERLSAFSLRDGERLYGEALAAARDGKQDAFDAALEAIRALPIPQREIESKTEALRSLLVEREQRDLVASIHKALDSGERETALQLAASLEAMGGKPSPELAQQLNAARERVAIDSYYRLMEWGDRIEAGELSRDEAEEVHRLVALARGPLPQRLASKATDNLHFFAAQAWRVLGESEKAWDEMGELRRIHPDSVYLQVE
ncbi:hypothetical protein GC173_06905 [bacterium]|nr:hypothetical protein [bacterium]